MARELPSGDVTFAFIDVVESTRTFTEHGDVFVEALGRLLATVAAVTEEYGGVVVKTEGDGAFLAFADADAAVRTLVEAQRLVESPTESGGLRPRMRAGAHRGPATAIAGDYVALAVNVAARVSSAAQAGQVLLSGSVVEALEDPELVALAGEPVGEFALKDVPGPTALWRPCGDGAVPRAPAYRPTNVLDPVTSFVGRAAELETLRELVAAHRLVTVLGTGGMGKTRLTSELLLAEAKRYAAGAWIAELASVEDSASVVGHVAAAVGSTARNVEELVSDVARRGTMVLLLDNCEHVLDAAAELAAALLAGCPDLRVVATSREALRVEHEHVWRIPGLEGAEARIELFTSRSWASGGRLDDADVELVTEVCERLDGMPLAIELAAAQTSAMPLTTLLELVTTGSDPLARRGTDRQASLDALVESSLTRLGPEHREALLVLSVAPGRLSAGDATRLLELASIRGANLPTGLLRDLVRGSLVDLDGNDYRLLDTIRAAARRRLRTDPAVEARARDALTTMAIELVTPYQRGHDETFSQVCSADRQLLLEQVAVEGYSNMPRGLGDVWGCLADIALYKPIGPAVVATASQALAEARRSMPTDADQVLAVAAAMMILAHAGNADWTAQDVARLVDAGRATGDIWCLTPCLFGALAYSAGFLKDLAEHGDYVTELQEVTRRIGTPYHVVGGTSAEAYLCFARGDLAGTVAAYERVLDLIETTGGRQNERPLFVSNLAEALTAMGRADEALERVTEALTHRPGHPHRWYLQVELARAHHALGHIDEALLVGHAVLSELNPGLSWVDQSVYDELLALVPGLADEPGDQVARRVSGAVD